MGVSLISHRDNTLLLEGAQLSLAWIGIVFARVDSCKHMEGKWHQEQMFFHIYPFQDNILTTLSLEEVLEGPTIWLERKNKKQQKLIYHRTCLCES